MPIGNATRAKLERVEQMGCLHSDPGRLAGDVMRALGDGAKVVWTDDEERVFLAPEDERAHLPRHWIVGTFRIGQRLDEIADGLLAARGTRAGGCMAYAAAR